MDDLRAQWETAIGMDIGPILVLALAVAALLAAVVVAWRLLAWRARPIRLPEPDLAIDVKTLGNEGPPGNGATLLFYHVPVRLAVVVMAPVGADRQIPTPDEIGPVYDSVVPFFSRVVADHHPVVRFWGTQLSPRGFAHAFFASVRLPGDQGKGTPWASAAGVFKAKGAPVMVGLVFRAAADVYIGQTICETETKWLDILRVQP